MANDYDVVVIGSGTGGYVAAIRAAQLGLSTAVVERAPVLGGTCLNWGCIPTKALLEHAHALKIAQDWKEWGLTIGQAAIGLDMSQVQARKDKIVKGLTGGIELLFKKNKIDWIKGSGRLAGKGMVEITEATDADAHGAQGDHRRDRLAAAQRAGHRDRSQADHHERRSDRPQGDSEVDRHPGERRGRRRVRLDLPPLRQRGHHHRAAAAHRAGRGRSGVGGARAVVQEAGHQGADGHEGHEREGRAPTASRSRRRLSDGKTGKLNAEYLLVATGRGPVTTGLGAEEAGLRMERGYVHVDAEFRTSVPGISAIGDVITFDKPGHPQLAHLSSAEGIALAERIAGQRVPRRSTTTRSPAAPTAIRRSAASG